MALEGPTTAARAIAINMTIPSFNLFQNGIHGAERIPLNSNDQRYPRPETCSAENIDPKGRDLLQKAWWRTYAMTMAARGACMNIS
jgi:hypothetical protein